MAVEEIDAPEFEKYLESEKVYVKARGEVNGQLKIYAYSYESNMNLAVLLELNLDFPNQEVNYTVKCQNEKIIQMYEDFLLKIIEPIL